MLQLSHLSPHPSGNMTLSIAACSSVQSERARDASDQAQCHWDQDRIICNVTERALRTLKRKLTGASSWMEIPVHSIRVCLSSCISPNAAPGLCSCVPRNNLGYITSDFRVRKNKACFRFLIINNLFKAMVLVWELTSSKTQQTCSVASWVVWFLGIPVLFSLLSGTVRLNGNKDFRKLRLSYYSFLIF